MRMITLLAALAGLSLAQATQAALHDTGPMGATAPGAPTPDAAVLSKMRLPDPPTPLPLSATAISATAKEAKDEGPSSAGLLKQDVDAMVKRIDAAVGNGVLSAKDAAHLQAQLASSKAALHLQQEADYEKLNGKQRRKLRAKLDQLDKKIKLARQGT